MSTIFEIATTAPKSSSATISLVNSADLKTITRTRFGGVLPTPLSSMPNERLRGDLSSRDAVWGITEASSTSSKHLSSTSVLCEEEVWFYIKPSGHPAAFLKGANNDTVFAESTLTISIHDTVHDTTETLDFRNFRLAPDDPGRYMRWVVPSPDRSNRILYDQIGVHGLFVLTITESYRLYKDSNWTQEIDLPLDMAVPQNLSSVYIRAYLWSQVLHDVTQIGENLNNGVLEDAYMLTCIPDPTSSDTPEDIYDNCSDYPSFERLDSPLSDDEKRVVIMDNSLALLSSQIPLLTSDSPLAGLIPIGMGESTPGSQEPPVVARIDSGIPSDNISQPRTFSLDGVPAAFNLHSDLSMLTSIRNAGGVTLQDPPRFFVSNSSGDLDTSAADSGIGFCLRGHTVTSMQAPCNSHPSESLELVLGSDSPYVETIAIAYEDSSIDISISDISNEELISSISFKVAVGDQNYSYYLDETGKVREHSFYLPSLGLLLGSIINIEIGIEDIDGNVRFFNRSKFVYPEEYAIPILYNIRAKQRRDGSGNVEIMYDYAHPLEKGACSVSLFISDDGGETYSIVAKSAKGDVGDGILPGTNRTIVWNPSDDEVKAKPSYVARLAAVAAGAQPVEGETRSGAFSVYHAPTFSRTTFYSSDKIERFGVDSKINLKNTDLTVDNIEEVYLISTSSSSSVSSESTPSSESTSSLSSASSRSTSSASSSSASSSSSSSVSSSCSLALEGIGYWYVGVDFVVQ